jgi:L,D-transpeptidase catalytic domain
MSVARLAPVAVLLVLAGCGGHSQKAATIPPATATQATPATPAAAAAPTFAIPAGSGHLAGMARRGGLVLRDKPGGKVIAHLKSRTAWGSPTVVWSVARRGPWLGVVATSLRNNQVGWLDVRRDHPRLWRSQFTLIADLSQRTLELRHDGRLVRRMSVGIGAPATPTPVGRFTVTDKLLPDPGVSYYGCCLLALSGHQPHLRPGWAGGDRIAIHGSGTLGTAASAGCLHASDTDLEMLMRRVPLGTPVYIRA